MNTSSSYLNNKNLSFNRQIALDICTNILSSYIYEVFRGEGIITNTFSYFLNNKKPL